LKGLSKVVVFKQTGGSEQLGKPRCKVAFISIAFFDRSLPITKATQENICESISAEEVRT